MSMGVIVNGFEDTEVIRVLPNGTIFEGSADEAEEATDDLLNVYGAIYNACELLNGNLEIQVM